MMLSIRIVIDNTSHNPAIMCEHGLSIWFQYNNRQWLFDTGASRGFGINAQAMNISLAQIDSLVLSHAHNDHTGGLRLFLQENHHAPIYLSAAIQGARYFSMRSGQRRYNGINNELLNCYATRFVAIQKNEEVWKDVFLLSTTPCLHPQPLGNGFLYTERGDKIHHDSFDHELAMVINTKNGLVILSACSHTGILNVVEGAKALCKGKKIIAIIGGTHLIDGLETPEQIINIGDYLTKYHPDMTLYTGHCTGELALKTLQERMPGRCIAIHSGMSVEFD